MLYSGKELGVPFDRGDYFPLGSRASSKQDRRVVPFRSIYGLVGGKYRWQSAYAPSSVHQPTIDGFSRYARDILRSELLLNLIRKKIFVDK